MVKRELYRRLLLSFSSLSLLLVVGLTISIYLPFSRNYEREIENLYTANLRYLRDIIENTVIKEAYETYFTLTGNTQYSSDITCYFDHPPDENKAGLHSAHTVLQDQVNSRTGRLIRAITVYYRQYGIFLSSSFGVRFLDGKARDVYREFDWFDAPDKPLVSEYWIPTRPVREVPESASGETIDVFSYVRTYPWGCDVDEARGFLALDFDPGYFSQVIWPMAAEDACIVLLDADGAGISVWNEPSNNGDFGAFAAFIADVSAGESQLRIEYERDTYILNSVMIPKVDWRLYSLVPANSFYRKAAVVRNRTILIGSVLSLIGILLSLLFSLRLYRPVGGVVAKINTLVSVRDAGAQENTDLQLIDRYIDRVSDEISELREMLEANALLLRQNLVRDLMMHTGGTCEPDGKMAFLNISFPFRRFSALLLRRNDRSSRIDFGTIEYDKFRIIEQMEKIQRRGLFCLGTELSECTLGFIINHDLERGRLVETLEEILDPVIGKDSHAYTAALGRSCDAPEPLHYSKAEAEILFSCRFFFPETGFLHDEALLEREEADLPLSDDLVEDFVAVLDNADPEALSVFLESLRNTLCSETHSSSRCRYLLNTLVYQLSSYARRMSFAVLQSRGKDYFEESRRQENIDLFIAWIRKEVEEVRFSVENTRHNPRNHHIQSVQQFIADNLQQELSLTIVAEEAGLSEVYLSRIFKQETGMNFTDFVNELRLDRAKDLLLASFDQIGRIAAQSGFTSAAYFNRKFRERYGTSPGLYRRAYHARLHGHPD